MRRVSVVGTSGAGKSTLARSLAAGLGADFLELDSVNHQADWVPLPTAEFRRRVAAVVAGERWVIDGNYSTVRDIVWARADTVVWLDLPRRTVMRRIVWRTLRRVAGRAELWNGNRERWHNLFTWTRRSPSSPGPGRHMTRTGQSSWRRWPIRRTAISASFGSPARRRCGGSCVRQAATSSDGSAMTSTRAPLRMTVIARGRPIASENISRCRSWEVLTGCPPR